MNEEEGLFNSAFIANPDFILLNAARALWVDFPQVYGPPTASHYFLQHGIPDYFSLAVVWIFGYPAGDYKVWAWTEAIAAIKFTSSFPHAHQLQEIRRIFAIFIKAHQKKHRRIASMARKNPSSGWIGLLFIIFIFLGYRAIQGLSPFGNSVNDRDETFTMYPDFGIELPGAYHIHGIDVSRYQSSINWRLVQKMQSRDVKIGFAFIKATEGITLTDRHFSRNWRKSREAGVTRGAYHFFRANSDAAAQARRFIKEVTLLPGDLPPVLDVETLDNTSITEFQDKVALWLLLVEQHYKVKPIIYSNATFYQNYLHPRFADYPLWVAHYKERNRPKVSRQWIVWQHNEGGRVNGINHHVDFNVFNGDGAQFRALLIP